MRGWNGRFRKGRPFAFYGRPHPTDNAATQAIKQTNITIMLQLLLHMWGDYVLQNDWMANNKAKPGPKGSVACTVHCLLYTLPFALFLPGATAWMLLGIFGTHWVIDRFRLAKYLMMLKNWKFEGIGFGAETPVWLSTWLLFIVDNILHVTINYIII